MKTANPYIAGKSLTGSHGFFGRDDILALVEEQVSNEDRNALVLFGQRRIGKTSILLQLKRRLPRPAFLPVYFDLMDRAYQPLGKVLFEMADAIAEQAEIDLPKEADFDPDGHYFRRGFLPRVYQALGESRPVLLLDEFDVLDVAVERDLRQDAAARVFFRTFAG